MPLYVSRRYVKTLEGVAVTPFECKRCGHETFAAVLSVGTGEETAGVLSNQSDAKNLAHSRAGHELMVNARLMASMARCPACRTVDEATMAGARNGALFKATLVAAIPAGLSYAYHRGEGAPFVMFVVVSIGAVIGACLSFLSDRWRWAEADERVRFLSGAELEAAQQAAPLNPPAARLVRAFNRARDHARKVLEDDGSHAGRFTARPWVLLEQGWEPWQIPSGHPLDALVNALDAELGPNAWRF